MSIGVLLTGFVSVELFVYIGFSSGLASEVEG